MAGEDLRLTKLHQVALPVSDLDRAITFYPDKLGAEFTMKFDPPGLAFFDLDGTRLMLDEIAEAGGQAGLTALLLGRRHSRCPPGAAIARHRIRRGPSPHQPHRSGRRGVDGLPPRPGRQHPRDRHAASALVGGLGDRREVLADEGLHFGAVADAKGECLVARRRAQLEGQEAAALTLEADPLTGGTQQLGASRIAERDRLALLGNFNALLDQRLQHVSVRGTLC
ncbi:MAG: hypothetical protein HOH95_10515 [Dehalococcoidia bacterium]|nr:hypothetical protein [Dehalococcoidia bacterium]